VVGPNENPRKEGVERLLPDLLERRELVGKLVRLSDGQEGEVVFVEYEAPGRVALVKTFPETPSPLTRAAVDRYSPPHLPAITEILGDAPRRG
jgi:hypothetical protein